MPPKGAKWVNNAWVRPLVSTSSSAPLRSAVRSRAATPGTRVRLEAPERPPVMVQAPREEAAILDNRPVRPARADQYVVARPRPARAPRRRFWIRTLFSWDPRVLVASAVLLVCMHGIPTVAKSADALLSSMASLGGAAGHLAWAGANLTEAVSSVVVASTASSLSLVDEAWRGIDLVNVTARAESGRLVIDDPSQLIVYLKSAPGADLLPVPDNIRRFIAERAAGIGRRVPSLSVSRSEFNSTGGIWQVECTFTLVANDYLAMAWRVGWAKFDLQWANPFWDLLEMCTDTETEQIQKKALAVLSGLLAEHASAWQAGFADVPLIETSPWQVWQRYLWWVFTWPWSAL